MFVQNSGPDYGWTAIGVISTIQRYPSINLHTDLFHFIETWDFLRKIVEEIWGNDCPPGTDLPRGNCQDGTGTKSLSGEETESGSNERGEGGEDSGEGEGGDDRGEGEGGEDGGEGEGGEAGGEGEGGEAGGEGEGGEAGGE